ncbi:MAG TPA: autotransporter-associated beta strand repeat-containing protein, partial [Candidatus Acidoferrum sp.]|nr:autotransporter-associated beta strand repeat-containing protein [Candidatus Acidoferrum sp.]
MKFNNIRVTVLAFIAFGNALSLLGQTTIFEEARYGPNNANGSNNPDFAYGSGISATLSSIKSTAPGFPVPADSSSCRFFGASGTANSWFTVTPSGTNQLTVGQSYAVGITFGNNTAAGQNQNSNIVVNITDSGTTGIDTVAGLSSVFATNTTPVNTWGTIGHVTINSATPSFTFTWASGFTNNRWYVDTVRFVPLGTVGTAQYWDTGSIGGTGAWDATSLNWNPNSDGSGTPATYSPVGLAVFGGAPGTVSVDPGGVTVNGGMQFDVSGYTVQGGTLTLGTAPFIWITNGASVAINCALSGTNGLVLPVAGTLTLGAPVTSLTGRVTLAGGTTLTLSPSGSQNFSSLTGGGALNIGAATLTVGSDNSTTTYAGILSDGGSGNPGALVKAGTGILILGGANTYAGSTTISGGQINVNADAALGTAPASLDPSHLTLDDGTCLYSAKTGGSVLTLSANRGITLNGNTTISGNTAAKEITFNCPITGSGSLSLPCTWPDFNATNSFAGDLILNMTNGSVSARFNVNNCAGAGRVHVFPQLNAGNDTITIRNNTASGATLTNGFFFDESVSHSP